MAGPLSYDEELAREAQRLQVKKDLALRQAMEEVEDIVLPSMNARLQLQQTFEPPLWRIENLHLVGSNTTITASYKTGKSTLMLNLLRSLCDGVPFLDQQVNPPERNIAYWNLELDENLWLEDLTKIDIRNLDRLYPLHLRGVKLPLYHPEIEKKVVAWLRDNDIEVLIIDPGARLLPGWPGSNNPENDNGTIGEVVQKLDEVKLAGGVRDLFLPLHTGRGSNSGDALHARGATKWDDWTDHLFQMWKKKVEGEGEIRHFKAYGRKVDFPEKLIAWDKATNRYTVEDTVETVQARGRAKSVVIGIIDLGGRATAGDLRKATKGVSNEGFPAAVEEALKRGFIKVDKAGRSDIHSLNLENETVQGLLMERGEQL